MRLPRWLGGKPKPADVPVDVPEVAIESTSPTLKTSDDFNFYERIRVMHVQQHPTSRFCPLNGLPPEEVYRRGTQSWFMHQLGKDPTLEEVAYAISPQFQLDKETFKENN